METEILNLLKRKKRVALTLDEISALLGISNNYEELKNTLNRLCQEGKIYYKENKKKYILMKNTSFKTGQLLVNPKGYGFVIVDKYLDQDDIYIKENNLLNGRNNDYVVVEIIDAYSNEGKIIKILKRDTTSLVGTVYQKDQLFYVKPDKSEYFDIYIPNEYLKGAMAGHKVIVKQIDHDGKYYGQVIKIIGHQNDIGIDILSLAYQYGFDPIIDDKIIEYVESIPSHVLPEETTGRIDLRKQMIFTIDGDDAKDLDDAISISKISANEYELGVHIADVSHYVKKDSILDKDAYQKGTSVYLVDRVIPMLPHKLSNGICSLNPGEDRLAISCVMVINRWGNVTNYKIFPSVIQSKKKMTYREVNEFLEKGNIPKGYEKFIDYLKLMDELSKILRKKMIDRGYIEFNSKEVNILVDQKTHPLKITLREYLSGEKMIENFMIVANETIATYIEGRHLPGIYRIHDKPNIKKLKELLKFLTIKGYNVKGNVNQFTNFDYQKLLAMFKGKDEEFVMNTLLIQTMSKAKYADINIGHFGLSSKRYSHFTAPIRRYPDLTLHRLIKDYLNKSNPENISYWQNTLFDIAMHSSLKEQDAITCEREVNKMKEAEYMADHLKEIYEGIISGVCEFGFFVELDNTIEGLVKLDSLKNDHYIFRKDLQAIIGKNSQKKYMCGDKVTVKVISSSKETSQIDFEIIPNKNNSTTYKKIKRP